MLQSNLHTHSNYCDGKSPIESYVIRAIKNGLHVIGMSSHAPLPLENKWSIKVNQMGSYLDELSHVKRKYKTQISIYSGLEADYIEGIASPSNLRIEYPQLDYIIGSVHYIYIKELDEYVEIDGKHKRFLKACEAIGTMQVVQLYYAALRKMLTHETIDIVGHLDKIKIQNSTNLLFNEKEDWYQEEIELTLNRLAKSNAIMEVNTRGMYKKITKEPYPSWWIIEKAIAKGIKLTISSDAHRPKELQLGFPEVLKKLKKLNCKVLMCFHNGKWEHQTI